MSTNNGNELHLEQIPDISSQQQKAITLLVAGNSQVITAKEIGVTPETVSRWTNHNPDFVAALRRAKISQYEAVQNGLTELSLLAVEELGKVLKSGGPVHKLAAAKIILSAIQPPATGYVSPARVRAELANRLEPRLNFGDIFG